MCLGSLMLVNVAKCLAAAAIARGKYGNGLEDFRWGIFGYSQVGLRT